MEMINLFTWKMRIQTSKDSYHNLNKLFKLQQYIIVTLTNYVNKRLKHMYYDSEFLTLLQEITNVNMEISLSSDIARTKSLKTYKNTLLSDFDIILSKYELTRPIIGSIINKQMKYYNWNDNIFLTTLTSYFYEDVYEDFYLQRRYLNIEYSKETFLFKAENNYNELKCLNNTFILKVKTNKDKNVLLTKDLIYVKFFRRNKTTDKYKYYAVLYFKNERTDDNVLGHTSRYWV